MVVTADDLGLHPAIDQGILEAHRRGLVTCASLVACGETFHQASDHLASAPDLQVAVHLTLVEERPVSPPSVVPSLVGADGRFPRNYRDFIRRFLARRIAPTDIASELRAQVERILSVGVAPVTLNSHQHLHLLPGIWEIVLRLAAEYRIPNIRLSRFRPLWTRSSGVETVYRSGLNLLARRATTVAAATGCESRLVPTVGLHAAGHLREDSLREIVADLPAGVHELVCHPGHSTAALAERYRWGFEWSSETAALCALSRDEVAGLGVEIASF